MGEALLIVAVLAVLVPTSALVWFWRVKHRCKTCGRWFSVGLINQWPGVKIYQCDRCGGYYKVKS